MATKKAVNQKGKVTPKAKPAVKAKETARRAKPIAQTKAKPAKAKAKAKATTPKAATPKG